MKKVYFLVSLIVISLLMVSLVYAAWYDVLKRITGKPIETTPCTETDGGKDFYHNGTTIGQIGFTIVEKPDKCKSKSILIEWYCEGDKVKSTSAKCDSGCSNGACIIPAPSCTDSDNGIDEWTAGTTTDSSGTYRDFCAGNSSLVEYSCQDDIAVNQTVNCGYKCQNRACIVKPFSCTDSDNGKDANIAGVAKLTYTEGGFEVERDRCSGNILSEAYCGERGIGVAKIVCKGICENQTVIVDNVNYSAAYCEPQPLTCTDTDNGKDYAVNGTVTSTDAAGVSTNYADECKSRNQLKEYYCENNTSKSEIKICNGTCQNGKCVAPTETCSDSDNGKDFSVKGTVITQYGSVSDFCFDNKKIAEFYCKKPNKAVISLTTRICKEKCSDGKCVGIVSSSSGEGVNQ